MRVDEEKLCVEFTRLKGDPWYFYEEFSFMRHELDVINDATFD
jgi:hypothetical protein